MEITKRLDFVQIAVMILLMAMNVPFVTVKIL